MSMESELKFGKWRVLGDFTSTKSKGKVLCVCECGITRSVCKSSLSSGKSDNCGCQRKKVLSARNSKHGMAGIRLYRVWKNIKARCLNSRASHFNRYGGRGISVCDEWAKNFSIFYQWAICNGYKDFLEIDRIDNDGNYCPENCRFVTKKENCRNRASNVLTFQKAEEIRKLKHLPQRTIAAMFGINRSLVWAVIRGEIWKTDQTTS